MFRQIAACAAVLEKAIAQKAGLGWIGKIFQITLTVECLQRIAGVKLPCPEECLETKTAGVCVRRKLLTTSSLKRMAALMPTVICRVCAGRVIRRRRPGITGTGVRTAKLYGGRANGENAEIGRASCRERV